MCGRYTLSAPGQEVALLFGFSEVPDLPPRYNLAPTQEAAVVRVLAPGEPRRLDRLRWGLIPYWAKEAAIGNRLINARAETAAEKPAYKWSFKKKRCLVPADGFYEWRKEGKAKQPYWIHRKDGKPFAFAGLWSTWKDPERPDSEPVETFTILTTDPNPVVAPLHDRMPLVLPREHYDLWLDPAVQTPERLTPLLAPPPGEDWQAFPVSRGVNSPHHDEPDCIEPLVVD
jgi:putative SOS response-associated peptidase YedK